MTFTTVPVSGSYLNPVTGAPCIGTVTFTLSHGQIRNSDQTAGPTFTVTLDSSGNLSARIPAVNDTGTTPQGSVYQVVENLSGGLGSTYTLPVLVSHATEGIRLPGLPAASTNRPTVTGAKGGNAALGSLLTGLASLGLITDNTTA